MKFSIPSKVILIAVLLLIVLVDLFLFWQIKEEILPKAKKQDIVKEESLSGTNKEQVKEDIKKEEVKIEETFDVNQLKWSIVLKEAPFAKRDAHNVVVFLDKLWLLGGVGGNAPHYEENYGDIWNSEDGKNWKLVTNNAPFGPRRAGESLVFQNKLWVFGGVTTGEKYLNDVWYTEDGINWILAKKEADWLPRKGFGSVVFKDKIWIIGGVDITGPVNDVWYSGDGANWTLAIKKAPFRERYDLAVETFSGKMWVSGGVFPEELGEQDVWYTEDGANWKKSETPSFAGRHGHCFLAYKDYLSVIGGWSGYAKGYNDTWYSKDGVGYQELSGKDYPIWEGREDLECVNFQNKIFMIGGMKTNGQRTNDVWTLSE